MDDNKNDKISKKTQQSNVHILSAGGGKTSAAATPAPVSEASLQKQQQYLLSPFVLHGAANLIQQQILAVDADGIIRLRESRVLQPLAMDFIVVRMHPWFQCWWRHEVLFKNYGLLPQDCLKCWKVVARPRNLASLMDVYSYQLQHPDSCKCGVETRPYIRGFYGAYWYNQSREEGEQCWTRLKNDLSHLDMELFLKRGCTEYEMRFGDSASWEEISVRNDFPAKEAAVRKYVEFGATPMSTPDVFIAPVIEQWYSYAAKHGEYHPDEFSLSRGMTEFKVRKYKEAVLGKATKPDYLGPRAN